MSPLLFVCSPANETTIYNEELDDKAKVVKHRKFKASQIPVQPVEMPSGVDTLTYDVSKRQ